MGSVCVDRALKDPHHTVAEEILHQLICINRYPIYRVSDLSSGAGFLPSTLVLFLDESSTTFVGN